MSQPNPNKTVFISYRRQVASFIARAIFLDLRAYGYDVFMDVESIDSGKFEDIILSQIAARTHFIIVLTPGTVERCIEPGDWLRREIEYAIDLDRNIVPLMVNDFSFRDTKTYLTGKLSDLEKYSGTFLRHEDFDDNMRKLRTRWLKPPQKPILVTPPTPAEQAAAEQKIEEAAALPAPTEQELSAEKLFIRGLTKRQKEDLEGAIDDYSEAIRLNPIICLCLQQSRCLVR
ncbi:MAG: TIR domain-containing protein, partial [Blastochloris sp.]|nr:TIR domain-containing protein [Blastochloris sp.]